MFASVAVVESLWAIRGNPLKVLSTQQLIDCARDPANGNNGCRGNTYSTTFNYIQRHGLTLEKNYPFLEKVRIIIYLVSIFNHNIH